MTTINITIENIFDKNIIDENEVVKITTKLLEYYVKTLKKQSCLNNYNYNSISFDILVCNSTKTQKLNKEYRNKDYPADILTFAVFADDDNRFILDGDINLGEIIISMDKVKEMANKDVSLAKNPMQEFYFLISHGLLHLLGFDHRDEAEYNFIIAEQRKALEKIDYDKIQVTGI